MDTVKFWRGTAERAVKTFAQAILALLTADNVFNLFTVDWREILLTALTTTVYSVLSSIASAGIGEPNSPSAITEPQ